MKLAVLLCAILALNSHHGYAGGIAGPVTGYAIDGRTGSVRPINGQPGSAVLGNAILAAPGLRIAAVHPRGELLLGISEDGYKEAMLVRNLGMSPMDWIPVDGGIYPVDSIELNANGTRALLYSRTAGKIQLLAGLAGRLEPSLPVSINNLGELTSVALAPSADDVVIVTERGIFRIAFGTGEVTAPIMIAAAPGVVTFGEQGDRLYLAENGRVAAMTELGTLLSLSPQDDASSPRQQVALCAGASRVAALADSPPSATVYDADSLQPLNEIPLPSRATRCVSLGGGLFLLNDAGDSPLIILDVTKPAAFFVPALEPVVP